MLTPADCSFRFPVDFGFLGLGIQQILRDHALFCAGTCGQRSHTAARQGELEVGKSGLAAISIEK